jgi:thiol-disulfide isomerase/thioredoxin
MRALINLLAFSTFFLYQYGQAQNRPVLLSYSIPTKQITELNIQKLGLKATLPTDPDFTIPLKMARNGVEKLNLITSGLYRIADGFNGHTIYLEPGDTVSIQLKELPNLNKILAANVFLPYFNRLTAKGKYAWHYLFFDELNRRTEKLYPTKDHEIVNNLMLFKAKCDNALSIGEKLLDSLKQKNKVSANFAFVAQQELNAIYVGRMCTPLSIVPRNKIYKSYFAKLNSLFFNDSAYAVQCNDYIQAGALYTYYIHNDLDVKNPYSNLSNEMKSIIANYTGIIKDKLLSWQIEDYIGKNYPDFDSCYQAYLTVCNNKRLKNAVIKKVNAYVKPVKNLAAIEVKALLQRSKVEDNNNQKQSLFSLCKDSSIVIIDCWATWCIPCREQMPFMHDFENRYAGKLTVLYLSFDKDEIKWKSFLQKNRLSKNQYLIDNNFASEFSQYFDLQTIPRYILVAKGGLSVLNARMPLPALKELFEEELQKYLKQ